VRTHVVLQIRTHAMILWHYTAPGALHPPSPTFADVGELMALHRTTIPQLSLLTTRGSPHANEPRKVRRIHHLSCQMGIRKRRIPDSEASIVYDMIDQAILDLAASGTDHS